VFFYRVGLKKKDSVAFLAKRFNLFYFIGFFFLKKKDSQLFVLCKKGVKKMTLHLFLYYK